MGKNGEERTDKVTRRRRFFKSFEAKSLANRNWVEKAADYVTASVGSVTFLLINCYFFFVWVIVNIDVIPNVVAFDPFPFGLLTMIVSLEAIILSVFILISQNRAANVDKLRDELHLQVNLIAEEEITKALEILSELREKAGIKKEDPELEKMLQRIDTSYIESSLERQLGGNSKSNVMNLLPTVNTSSPSQKSEEKK